MLLALMAAAITVPVLSWMSSALEPAVPVRFDDELLRRVERIPGVERAGLAAEDAVWTFGMGMGDDNSVVVWPAW